MTRRMFAALPLALAGCAASIPESGPTRGTVVDGAAIRIGEISDQEKLPYALVRVSSNVIAGLTPVDRPSLFSKDLTSATPVNGGIGVGDILGITIFEAGAGGLFIPAEPGTRSGNYVTLPNQQVDAAGNIDVPFAGTVRVAGLTPSAVEHALNGRLASRALDPQAIVSIIERRGNAITVTGDVGGSSHFFLEPSGQRLMEALARAGGPKYPPYETLVTLQRGPEIEKAFLSDIVRDPGQNIALAAGDSIFISRQQRYFLALGALGPGQYLGLVNRRLAFEDTHLSLADAVAKVGGLSDDRANARAVFLYRFESAATLGKLGMQVPPTLPQRLPTIYYLDLAEAAGYFFASEFSMRNEDLIYVSNAPTTDLIKFLNVILPAAYSSASFKTL